MIGYCFNFGGFLALNALYSVVVEGRFDLAYQTLIAPLAFACAGLIVLIPLAVSIAMSLRREGERRWVVITHGLLLLYYVMCFVAGKWIMGIEGSMVR